MADRPVDAGEAHTPDRPDRRAALLAGELHDLHAERIRLERLVAQQDVVERAVSLAERDRSALVSPTVQGLRERAQRLHDQLMEHWLELDRLRLYVERISSQARHLRGLSSRTSLMDALADEAHARGRFAVTVAESGMDLVVPAARGEAG